MKAPAQSAAIDAQAYASYLRTVAGRVRTDLAWENLRANLPEAGEHPRRALDVGGGTGEAALRLANAGFHVTVLDASEAMLAEAENQARHLGLSRSITLVLGDASELSRLFPPDGFDVVVCHYLLEFVERPLEVLRGISHMLAPEHSLCSIIVRNRAGEVLNAALKSGDLQAAEDNLTEPKVRISLGDPVSVFTPAELRDLLSTAGLEVIGEYGVRTITDYLPGNLSEDPSAYDRLLRLEQKLGRRAEFAAMARYTHMIARIGSSGHNSPRCNP